MGSEICVTAQAVLNSVVLTQSKFAVSYWALLLCTLQHISCLKSTCTDSDYVKGDGIKKSGKVLVSCTTQRRLDGTHTELCGRKEREMNGLQFSTLTLIMCRIRCV